MKLKHVTFTGIDSKTELIDLIELQKEYPIAEFGILTSYNWFDNGNRYPDLLSLLDELSKYKSSRLSLHLCGRAAVDAANGYWENIEEKLTHNLLCLFKRCQLNISDKNFNSNSYVHLPLIIGQEIIIQQKNINNLDIFDKTQSYYFNDKNNNCFSVLLDASGGRGIDTPIEIPNGDWKVGFAGGITPDNVEEKLNYLLHYDFSEREFWIDMESGVRTDDWFDLNKVEKVLKIVKELNNDFYL